MININDNQTEMLDFFDNTSLIEYSKENYSRKQFNNIDDIFFNNSDCVNWLNIYGFNHSKQIKEIIVKNNLDEFLINITQDTNHRNKVIELEDSLCLTLKILIFEDQELQFEQMIFIASPNYVWSIQEKVGDYFEEIRNRIRENRGILRKRNADYLLYRLIETIIDNYSISLEKLLQKNKELIDLDNIKPDPQFAITVEGGKQDLFKMKKALVSLREAIIGLEKLEIDNFSTHYFSEVKEQASFMIDDIDFNFQQLESSINLIFNIQSHQLNQVMKTLTVLSAIFIPLTFLAGVYGMNFKYIPELETHYGYFVIWGVMIVVAILTVSYFKRKKWF